MTILFFSGGLDSTTLAFDILNCPSRYGISQEGKNRPRLLLLTAAFTPEEVELTEERLKPLVSAMRDVGRMEVVHEVVYVEGMTSYEVEIPVPHGSLDVHPAVMDSRSASRHVMGVHYTPGLHSYLASIAINRHHSTYHQPHHNSEVAFWGFKLEGPVWEAQDAGTIARSDTTPEFVETLNRMSESLGHPETLRFRAPFLENRMDRYQVLDLAYALKMPVDATSSCVTGWHANCGYCWQCVIRNQAKAAWAAANPPKPFVPEVQMVSPVGVYLDVNFDIGSRDDGQ